MFKRYETLGKSRNLDCCIAQKNYALWAWNASTCDKPKKMFLQHIAHEVALLQLGILWAQMLDDTQKTEFSAALKANRKILLILGTLFRS